MRKIFIALMALGLFTLGAEAQETQTLKVPDWIQNVKLSGYGMVQYQASDKTGAQENGFQLRLVRLALDGRVNQDWYWKTQIQVNGNAFDQNEKGKTNSLTIRTVDVFAEWQKYKAFMVKAGQFKRPFTFENPMHPITQGFMSYSQPISKLAGFADRTGEQASNGRDIGVQVQGDVLPINGRNWLHYQVGVFNGEGINRKDMDNRKDVIGGMWIMPVDGMRIGVFGWTGSRADVGNKDRYAVSADYQKNDYTFRAEYVHSKGFGADVRDGENADGFYALGIVPIIKNKLHAKARYDVYRNEATWNIRKINYEVGVDYLFSKNVQLNVEYARVNEHVRNYSTLTIGRYNYNLLDVELDFRF